MFSYGSYGYGTMLHALITLLIQAGLQLKNCWDEHIDVWKQGGGSIISPISSEHPSACSTGPGPPSKCIPSKKAASGLILPSPCCRHADEDCKASCSKDSPVSTDKLKPPDTDSRTELGHGSYGIVHLERRDGKEVAVKTWYPELTKGTHSYEEEEYIRREYKNEVELLKSIDHPNVVRYVHSDPENFALEMEKLDMSLYECLCSKLLPRVCSILGILSNIASALSHIHEKKIVHSDLNPTNILLSAKDGTAKLCDFGVSRRVSEEISGGNPFYMPPNAVGQPASEKIDMFSFGLLILVAYYGSLPAPQINKRERNGRLIPEAERRSGLVSAVKNIMPTALFQFALKCIDPDPNCRPQAKDFPHNLLESSNKNLTEHKDLSDMVRVDQWEHTKASAQSSNQAAYIEWLVALACLLEVASWPFRGNASIQDILDDRLEHTIDSSDKNPEMSLTDSPALSSCLTLETLPTKGDISLFDGWYTAALNIVSGPHCIDWPSSLDFVKDIVSQSVPLIGVSSMGLSNMLCVVPTFDQLSSHSIVKKLAQAAHVYSMSIVPSSEWQSTALKTACGLQLCIFHRRSEAENKEKSLPAGCTEERSAKGAITRRKAMVNDHKEDSTKDFSPLQSIKPQASSKDHENTSGRLKQPLLQQLSTSNTTLGTTKLNHTTDYGRKRKSDYTQPHSMQYLNWKRKQQHKVKIPLRCQLIAPSKARKPYHTYRYVFECDSGQLHFLLIRKKHCYRLIVSLTQGNMCAVYPCVTTFSDRKRKNSARSTRSSSSQSQGSASSSRSASSSESGHSSGIGCSSSGSDGNGEGDGENGDERRHRHQQGDPTEDREAEEEEKSNLNEQSQSSSSHEETSEQDPDPLSRQSSSSEENSRVDPRDRQYNNVQESEEEGSGSSQSVLAFLNSVMFQVDLIQPLLGRAGGTKHAGDISILARTRRSTPEPSNSCTDTGLEVLSSVSQGSSTAFTQGYASLSHHNEGDEYPSLSGVQAWSNPYIQPFSNQYPPDKVHVPSQGQVKTSIFLAQNIDAKGGTLIEAFKQWAAEKSGLEKTWNVIAALVWRRCSFGDKFGLNLSSLESEIQIRLETLVMTVPLSVLMRLTDSEFMSNVARLAERFMCYLERCTNRWTPLRCTLKDFIDMVKRGKTSVGDLVLTLTGRAHMIQRSHHTRNLPPKFSLHLPETHMPMHNTSMTDFFDLPSQPQSTDSIIQCNQNTFYSTPYVSIPSTTADAEDKLQFVAQDIIIMDQKSFNPPHFGVRELPDKQPIGPLVYCVELNEKHKVVELAESLLSAPCRVTLREAIHIWVRYTQVRPFYELVAEVICLKLKYGDLFAVGKDSCLLSDLECIVLDTGLMYLPASVLTQTTSAHQFLLMVVRVVDSFLEVWDTNVLDQVKFHDDLCKLRALNAWFTQLQPEEEWMDEDLLLCALLHMGCLHIIRN